MIKKSLATFQSLLKPFTELRLHENRESYIGLLNGDLIRNTNTTTGGVSARHCYEGYWGFAAKPSTKDDDIREVIIKAEENARFLASKGKAIEHGHEVQQDTKSYDFTVDRKKKSQSEIIAYLTEMDEYFKARYPEVDKRMFIYIAREMEKNLLTSDETSSYLNWPNGFIYCNFAVMKDGEPTELSKIIENKDLFKELDVLKPELDEFYHSLIKKRDGVIATAGMHDVILDADLAGILAHEALGHTAEADLVKGGSVAGDFLNQKVASELITLVDFAHTYNGETLPCPIYIDDEGVIAKDAVIIEKGILKGFMHNRDSSVEMKMPLTGNARAWSYLDEPLIRMRNTAILPGNSTLEEMIASIDHGYYFKQSSNGQADTTGEFMFGVAEGYEIIDGKLGKAIKDTTISGQAFDVLSSVTMVSNEMTWSSAGMCGKKQPIPTGMGGPAIKCKINVGGQ